MTFKNYSWFKENHQTISSRSSFTYLGTSTFDSGAAKVQQETRLIKASLNKLLIKFWLLQDVY